MLMYCENCGDKIENFQSYLLLNSHIVCEYDKIFCSEECLCEWLKRKDYITEEVNSIQE